MTAPLYTAPGTAVVRAGRTPSGAHVVIHGVVRRRVHKPRQPLLLEVREDDGTVTTLPAASWRPEDLTLVPPPVAPSGRHR